MATTPNVLFDLQLHDDQLDGISGDVGGEDWLYGSSVNVHFTRTP